MDVSGSAKIPSVNLQHNGMPVHFAYRTMEEIDANQTGLRDLPHRHNYYTILWAQNACGQHFIDYREYQIKPNKVFFVSPGQVHQVITKKGASGLVLLFTREFLHQQNISEEFIRNLGLFADIPDTPPLYLSDEGAKILGELTDKIANTFHDEFIYKHEMIGAYLKLFLIECNRFAVIPKEDFPSYDFTSRDIVRSFKNLLEENFHQWHKVSDYASELAISPDYLNNVLKSAIGKSAKEFIQERIILEAKRLGLHTSKSSKEISFSLGFSEPSHFSRFYKNVAKQSFSDFRNSLSSL